MAFTRIQGNATDDPTDGSTIAVTISAVGNGNAICGFVAWDTTFGNLTLSSVVDDKSNTYNIETTVTDTTNNERMAGFSRTNITNAPTVITATFSAACGGRKIIVDEFSGASTASSDERDGAAHGGQFQNAPGTGTDAITSGTFTTSTNGDLIWGACIDGGGTTVLASNGTGFSTGTQNNTTFAGQTEYLTQSTAGAGTAATFTQAAGTMRSTFLLAIKPAAGGGAAAPFIPEDTSVPPIRMPPVSLRNWTWAYNLNLVGGDTLPPGRRGALYDDPSRGYLPAGPPWTWQYNPNLIGRDVFPPGRKGAFADLASRGYPPPGDTWTWQYNLNLVAKDVLPPGRQRSERPQPSSWFRDWTQNLLLSTLSITVQRPFNQYDWPLPVRAAQPDRTWVSSAAMLQLILPPPGDIWTDLPPAPQFWRRDWSQNLVLSTLVSQDSLPPGQQRTETPPPVSWRRDWTQSLVLSTLAGQDSLPPRGISNRILIPTPQQRDWSQNLLLSTLTPVIQTPFNQYDWTIPQRPPPAGQTWTLNLLLSTLAPAIVLPLNQYDWPVPQRTAQPPRGFAASFNLNLIAQDQLPFRQSDWPLPRSYYYPLSVKDVATLNLNLFPPPVIVPAPVGEFNNPPFIGTSVGQMGSWS